MKNKAVFGALLSGFLLVSCNPFNFPMTSNSSTTSENSNSSNNLTDSSTENLFTLSRDEYIDYFDGYYDSILTWENSNSLIKKLENLRKDTIIPQKYDGNWEICQKSCQSLENFLTVDVVYSSENDLKTNTNNGSSGWQREHAFPATLMTGLTSSTAVKTLGIATDFHNLWASSGSGNTSRGNKNYGVAGENATKKDDYKYDTKNFEPGDHDKGKLSRSIFYIASSYHEENGIFLQEEINNDTSIRAHGNLSTLIDWNSNFDVDRLEIEHNEQVYLAQNNRNPFVDFPELVDYCYGSKKSESGELKNLISTREKLEINLKNHVNYAISNYKTTYYVGENFSLDDITVVSVKNDFTYTKIPSEEYTLTNVLNDHLFKEEDISSNFELELAVHNTIIKFYVKVLDSKMENSNFYHKFDKTDFSGITGGTPKDITIEQIKFNAYIKNGSVGNNSTKNGVTFGTAANPIEEFYLESSGEFSYENYSKINSIYLKANVASGETAKLNIYVNNDIIHTETIKYDSTGSNTIYGLDLDNKLTGKVKIEVLNIKKAFYLFDLAIDCEL